MTGPERIPAQPVRPTAFGWVMLGALAAVLTGLSVRDPGGTGVIVSGSVIAYAVGWWRGRGFDGGTRVEWARWVGRMSRGFALGFLAAGAWWGVWGWAEGDPLLIAGGVAGLVASVWMDGVVTAEEEDEVAAARQHEEGVW